MTKPTEKSEGQLGGQQSLPGPGQPLRSNPLDSSSAAAEGSEDPAQMEKGDKTAENVRYGQNVSESGMGGMTKGMDGKVQQGMVPSKNPHEQGLIRCRWLW